MFRTTIELIYY